VTFGPPGTDRRPSPEHPLAPDDRDMTKPLDVLVIESHPGAAAEAVQALEAAGHHVHRCYDDHSHGFPCLGVIDPAECPLARRTDVALLVRRRVAPGPTALEQGATCAIRAGVPLVEAGPEPLVPSSPGSPLASMRTSWSPARP
jgi:hypothetical protein